MSDFAGCHRPSVKQGDLSLTNYEAFMEGGAKGNLFQPGQPDHSLVIGYLTGIQKPQMPLRPDATYARAN